MPTINKLVSKQTKFIFGLKSLTQLNNWFSPEELLALKDHGFKVKKYKAKKAFITPHQVLFTPSN